MRFSPVRLFLLCTLPFLFTPANAQQPFWRSMSGPYGGPMVSIAAGANGWLYAAGRDGGVFRSDDRGERWELLAPESTWWHPYPILCDSRGTVFAHTPGAWVFSRSTDYGATWTTHKIRPEMAIFALHHMPGDTLLAGTGNGLYRSVDRGSSWVHIANSLDNPVLLKLSSDSAGVLYAQTGTRFGFMRSTDGGRTWSPVNELLGPGPGPHVLVTRRGTVIASWLDMYRHTVLDTEWRVCSPTGRPQKFMRVSPAPNGDLIAFSMSDVPFERRVWRSVDDGETWDNAYGVPWAEESAIIGNDMFLATSDGVYRSRDNGSTWSAANQKLTAMAINDMIVSPDGTIITAGNVGMNRSTDDGDTWQKADTTGPIYADMLAKCADGSVLAVGQRVYRSTDAGTSWTNVPGGDAVPHIAAIAGSGSILIAGGAYGIYRSEDNGKSWEYTSMGLVFATALAGAPDGRLYAVSRASRDGWSSVFEVHRSADNGISWQKIFTYDSLGKIAATSYGRIVVSSDSSVGAIHISDDMGATWRTQYLSSLRIATLALDADENILLGTSAASPEQGPYVLRRNLSVFEPLRDGFDGKSSTVFAVSPRGYVVAASRMGGIYRSTRSISAAERSDERVRAIRMSCAPNPCAADTRLSFELPGGALATIEVFDAAGRPVYAAPRRHYPAGEHVVEISTAGLPNGIYRCVLTAGPIRSCIPLIVAR